MRGKLQTKRIDAPESPLRYAIFSTGQGWLGLLASGKGLLAATLPQTSKEAALERLGEDIEKAAPDDGFFSDIVSRLREYFSGHPVSFEDEIDAGEVTPFQLKVWQTARTIPYGETRSYAWLARQIGKPAAPRAVGQALKRNRLPVIIPCHRVIASDGDIGGFSGGPAAKKRLLKLETTSP